jgi:hypothetical protein
MQYYNKNKLSLVGMQLPEKYKENFDASSREGPSWYSVTLDEGLSLETSKFSLYFPGSCIPTNESLFILLAQPIHCHRQLKNTIISRPAISCSL